MIHDDMWLTENDTIFTMVDTNGHRQSFLSPISGTVTRLYIHELDILSYGSIILEYEECRHTITFKNLCGICGINLNHVLPTPKPVIRMEPSMPEVTITREEGLRYDNEERNNLLGKRKLHLLIDLDQTLVHTTNTINHYASSPDVVTYQMNTPMPQTFYTKLRPGVKEFLTSLRSFYLFRIVTFGDRSYANTIVKLIDPDRTFFSHRILSRDECLSLTDKTANLTALFPCGDSLVCIIDDREDVWNYAPNLVQVKPYTWFKDVGDINSIYLSSPLVSCGQMIPLINEQIEIGENRRQRREKRKFYEENDELSEELTEQKNRQTSTVHNSNIVADTDIYLRHLEIILKRIHTAFYVAYDQWIIEKHGTMPDLKQIMPNIRRKILNSVSLCFSHLMPQNYPMEKHRATIMAKIMGAKVTHDLEFDRNGIIQTTHVIAGKQTLKVHRALQNNIKIVTPEWLIECYEHWEKRPEENYILTPEYDVRKSRLFTKEIPRAPKRRYDDMQKTTTERKRSQNANISLSNKIAQTDNCSMSVDELFNMEKEVNEFCLGDDDDSNDECSRPLKQIRTAEIIDDNKDDNEDSFESDSSYMQKLHDLILGKKADNSSDEENLSDDEVPRGWKQVHRQKLEYS